MAATAHLLWKTTFCPRPHSHAETSWEFCEQVTPDALCAAIFFTVIETLLVRQRCTSCRSLGRRQCVFIHPDDEQLFLLAASVPSTFSEPCDVTRRTSGQSKISFIILLRLLVVLLLLLLLLDPRPPKLSQSVLFSL